MSTLFRILHIKAVRTRDKTLSASPRRPHHSTVASMKLKFRAFLSLATLSAAYASPNYSFPDCVNGPLKSNTVCNAKAAYMDRAQALVAAMTLAELECNVVDSTCGVSRLGLPAYEWWSEALHGLAYSPGVSFGTWGQAFGSASQFPNGISLGAAFDDQLYAGMGQVSAMVVPAPFVLTFVSRSSLTRRARSTTPDAPASRTTLRSTSTPSATRAGVAAKRRPARTRCSSRTTRAPSSPRSRALTRCT
jgi:hypothetical protein